MLLSTTQYAIDRMNSTSIANLLGTSLHHAKNVRMGIYDFSLQGGATGDINLKDADGIANLVIPSGAIVTSTKIFVPVAVTSGGSATVAVKVTGSGDALAATAKASLSLNAILDGIQDNTATHMIRVTSDTNPVITVAVAALTAGKIYVYFEYIRSTF